MRTWPNACAAAHATRITANAGSAVSVDTRSADQPFIREVTAA